jgi:AcrR family transcriptional regulator
VSSPGQERGRAAPDERATREKILDVAEQLIDRHGMEGLRLKDVARGVGIRPPSVFAHFGGREAIGDAVARRVTGQIAGLFARLLDGGEDPESALRRGVRAFAGHLHDHPCHVRLLLRDLARTRRSSELSLDSPLIGELVERVAALLRAGERAGVFRSVDATAFVSMLEGAILARMGWHGFDDEGRPLLRLTRRRLQAQAEELALALVRPQP